MNLRRVTKIYKHNQRFYFRHQKTTWSYSYYEFYMANTGIFKCFVMSIIDVYHQKICLIYINTKEKHMFNIYNQIYLLFQRIFKSVSWYVVVELHLLSKRRQMNNFTSESYRIINMYKVSLLWLEIYIGCLKSQIIKKKFWVYLLKQHVSLPKYGIDRNNI